MTRWADGSTHRPEVARSDESLAAQSPYAPWPRLLPGPPQPHLDPAEHSLSMDLLFDSAAGKSAAVDAGVYPNDGNRELFPALSREICQPLISLCAGFDLLLAGAEGPISTDQRDQVHALRGHCV